MRLVDSRGGLVENDAELVRATQLHDRAAANALFRRYHRRVMAYCVLASGGDRSRAQDLAQETFARAFLGLRRLRHPERFAAFLFTVARNVCLTRGAQESRLLLMEMLGAGVDVAAPEPEEHCLRED